MSDPYYFLRERAGVVPADTPGSPRRIDPDEWIDAADETFTYAYSRVPDKPLPGDRSAVDWQDRYGPDYLVDKPIPKAVNRTMTVSGSIPPKSGHLRVLDCIHYVKCLKHAACLDWPDFSCAGCGAMECPDDD